MTSFRQRTITKAVPTGISPLAAATAAIAARSYGDPSRDARFRKIDAKGSVYIVGFDKYVKIGFSTDPKGRIAVLQSALPIPLVTYAIFDGTQIQEKAIHARYSEFRLRGEWFLLKGKVRAFVKRRSRI